MASVRINNFISGKFEDSQSYLKSFNPATGKVWAEIPDSTKNDVDRAVKVAHDAFSGWSSTPPESRAKILFKIADLIESQLEQLAEAESRDQGKPLWLAKTVDLPRCAVNFRHFATTVQCDKEHAIVQTEAGILNYTVHCPVGVAAVIVPWNLPLLLLTFKLAPALAYGNTVVAKPSEFTSVSSWMLCKIFKQAGLPDGVVNVIFGLGQTVGETLVTHPDVRMISFTGSTRTGTHISEVTAKDSKKLSLEMGGKNSAIVFDDCNLESCIQSLKRGSFINQGEVCLCTSIIYVQNGIYKEFLAKFTEETKKIKVGEQFEEGTWMGPLISKEHLQKVKGYVELGVKEGGTIHYAGKVEEKYSEGYFHAPVIFTNLPAESRLLKEEIFGPVTCIVPFTEENEVIQLANSTDYGLCASLWSKDVNKIHRVAPKLEVGTIWCNCWMLRNLHMPFGGMKMSGIGREGTEDSKDFYTEKKTICLKLD